MVKTAANPGGMPVEVLDGLRQQYAANRAQFYLDFASGPFYGFNRPGAKVSQGVIQNWWRQGMMGSTKAHYDGVKAFSETDFTEDLKTITVPTLVMHGDDDQIVPIANSALLSVEAAEERHAEGLREVPARHVHDARRRDQCRPSRLHQGLSQRGGPPESEFRTSRNAGTLGQGVATSWAWVRRSAEGDKHELGQHLTAR